MSHFPGNLTDARPATRKQSRFRSHRGLFHTYSVWILLGLTIFWLPTGTLTVSGIPVFNAGVKVLVWVYLAGVLCHLVADTGHDARELSA